MSPSPIGGSGGGGFDRYNIQPKKKNEESDGTEGSDAVVPKVPEPLPACPLRKSDDRVASTGDTSNSGLGERQRGGDPGLYKKPHPQQPVKPTTDEETTSAITIKDELTLSNEALATQPPLDPAAIAAYESQARKHPPGEFHEPEGSLDLNG